MLLFLLAQGVVVTPADPPLIGKELHDQIVSAIRNCPQSKGDEIAVCSKDRGYAERYRMQKLQKPLKPDPGFQIQLVAPGTAASGTGCTPTGSGGSTGCSAKDYDAWARWKTQQKADGRDAPW